MKRSPLLVAAAVSLLAATPAQANRDGDGPVRAPRILDTIHTEFTLPGSGWAQVVGALAGTPILGEYALDLTLPNGAPCRVSVMVDSKAQGVPPRVGRRIVRLHPLQRVPLRYTRAGRHGAVRWWTGTSQGLDAAAAAVQPMPAELRSKHRRYIATWVSVSHTAAPADDRACRTLARRTGAPAALRIVRTLKLADGPALSEPPLTPA